MKDFVTTVLCISIAFVTGCDVASDKQAETDAWMTIIIGCIALMCVLRWKTGIWMGTGLVIGGVGGLLMTNSGAWIALKVLGGICLLIGAINCFTLAIGCIIAVCYWLDLRDNGEDR